MCLEGYSLTLDTLGKKTVACSLLTASVCSMGRISNGQEEEGKKHYSLHMARLSYGELPTRAVQRGVISPTVQTNSMKVSLSTCLHALAESQPTGREKEREREGGGRERDRERQAFQAVETK